MTDLQKTEMEARQAKELEAFKAKQALQVRAAKAGRTAKAQLDYEKSKKAQDELKKKGLKKPTYEDGSMKIQVRVDLAWRAALTDLCEETGMNQSEAVRRGLMVMFGADRIERFGVEQVYSGRRLK